MDIEKENFFNILKYVKKHEDWMNETINLIASENRMSPLVAEVLKSDFGNRVAEGWLGERIFPGLEYYDKIEQYGLDLAKNMFEAEFVDVRPLSGTMANMIVYSAFTKPNDVIASISIASGAHISMSGKTPQKVFGLKFVELPFNNEDFTINLNGSIDIIKKYKPKILVLGGSVLLFAQPVKDLVNVCKETSTLVLYDASHVAGLIATGLFPNPLKAGADIMTLTLCKTIPGPQHAFIFSKNNFSGKIKNTTFPCFTSGHHLHETVASILTLEELKVFGKNYLTQTLRNARFLAESLHSFGFDVVAKGSGFTETHMFVIDISNICSSIEAEHLLEKANILVNRNILPNDTSHVSPNGLRIGTSEMTRLGAKEADMKEIAFFIKRILIDKESPESIKNEITLFRKPLQKIHFCYE